MKQIIKLITISLIFLTVLNAESISYDSGSKKLPLSFTSSIFESIQKDNFNTASSQAICGEVTKIYKENGKITKKETIKTHKVLIDFNAKTGVFTCLYENDNEFGKNKYIKVNKELQGYKGILNLIGGKNKEAKVSSPIEKPLSLFDSEYKPSNLWKLEKAKGKDELDIYKRASKMGLLAMSKSDIHTEKKNFSLSQFISSLLTLNSDVVLGVNDNGKIKIAPEVQKNMSVLHSENTTFTLNNVVDSISSAFLNYTPAGAVAKMMGVTPTNKVQKSKENLDYTSSNSYLSYFDKRIFALYYNFMTIGWGNIFTYASMMILALISMYTASVVGVKLLMHKIDDEKKDKQFEFPLKMRLITIGSVVALSFVQYPTGEGTTINSGDNVQATIQSQTSIAKNTISYLANIGANIADISASNSITVYLDFLLGATHSQGFKKITNLTDDLKSTVVQQKVKKAFFKNNCIESYKTRFDKLGGFQSVAVHEDTHWAVSDSWKNSDNEKQLGVDRVSTLLCKNLEKEIVMTKDLMTSSKTNIEKNLDSLVKMAGNKYTGIDNTTMSNSASQTNLAQMFALTQLQAVKDIGWIDIATLPILHIFMMNSNTLENGFASRTTSSAVSDSKISTMLSDGVTNQYYKEGREDSAKKLKNDGNPDSSYLEKMITSLLSYQVYMIMPGFEDVRQSMSNLISGSIDTIINLIPWGKGLGMMTSLLSSSSVKAGVGSLATYITSFVVAIMMYKIILGSIFAGLVTLLAILKIVLYFIELFTHFFVSPFIVLWQMTINERTNKLHNYITSGFVIYMIKPTLIVLSCVMFIFSYEIMQSIYSLSFDMIFSSLEFSNEMFDESDISSLITMGAIKGFGEIFVYIFGMILSYFMILKGDDLILGKFGYKDDSDNSFVSQLGDRIQQLSGGKV